MESVNYLDTIKINLHPGLASHAKKVIRGFGSQESDQLKDPKHTIDVIPWGSEKISTEASLKVDIFYELGKNFLIEKCKYKFSSWKYYLEITSPTHWKIKVSGDFYSSWVWPYRTLKNFLKFLAWKNDFYFFHSAGLYNGSSAVMMLAPSGTGKTLTSLHFLCNNGRIYNDDTVIFQNGKLLPSAKGVKFWKHRYENSSNVLPVNMPQLNNRDQSRSRSLKFIKWISFGMVSLGQNLAFEDYWPDAVPPPSEPTKILCLKKGFTFSTGKNPDPEAISNKLIGDLEFQTLPLLRLKDVFTLTGISLFEVDQFYTSYSQTFKNLLKSTETLEVSVPPLYTRTVFEKLNNLIKT